MINKLKYLFSAHLGRLILGAILMLFFAFNNILYYIGFVGLAIWVIYFIVLTFYGIKNSINE